MDKEEIAYINNGILFSHEEEGNPTVCDNIMPSEMSQTNTNTT